MGHRGFTPWFTSWTLENYPPVIFFVSDCSQPCSGGEFCRCFSTIRNVRNFHIWFMGSKPYRYPESIQNHQKFIVVFTQLIPAVLFCNFTMVTWPNSEASDRFFASSRKALCLGSTTSWDYWDLFEKLWPGCPMISRLLFWIYSNKKRGDKKMGFSMGFYGDLMIINGISIDRW